MGNEMVIQKLKELQSQIPKLKELSVRCRWTPEFQNWHSSLVKWLKLGHPHTAGELKKIEHKHYLADRQRFDEDDYNNQDERAYQDGLDVTLHAIDSAIENIEKGLIPEQPKVPDSPKKGSGSRVGDVNIGQARTVIMGDRNLVSVVESITVADFLDAMGREIEKRVDDPEEKRGLLQKFKEISQNPTATTILGQTLGQFLKSIFGQE